MNAITSFRLCTLSDMELLDKVDHLTDQIYKTGVIPSRHIPARPNEDYDLLVGELIVRFHERITIEEKPVIPKHRICPDCKEDINSESCICGVGFG